MKKVLINLLYPITVIIAILLIWYIASIIINVEIILPTPYVAFQNLGQYLGEVSFWVALGWTFLRCLESFIIAFILALLLSLLAYLSKPAEKFINPLVGFIRAVPTMAIIFILIIALSPNNAPLVVACIVISPTLYQTFLAGFKQIDNNLVEMVNVYKVPKSKQIAKFYIPSMLPVIFSNSATGFSLNIKLIIAAEALAQTSNSIGKLMQYAKINIEIEKLFALTIIAVVLSVISEFSIKLIMKRVCTYD